MTDLEKQPTGQLQEYQEYIPGKQSWDDLVSESTQVLGFDLTKDEYLDNLVGVPFIILRATFTQGFMRGQVQAAKVSCECLVAPKLDLHKIAQMRSANDLPALTDPELELPQPSATIVFNDGSTGIYRQVVEHLEMTGRITLPDGERNGRMGETVLDLPPSGWARIHDEEEFWIDDSGFMRYRGNMRFMAPRGLRISKYPSDYNPSGGKTRYLA